MTGFRGALCVLFALLATCHGALAVEAAGRVVTYPPGESNRDPRLRYPVQVLELALEKAGGQFVAAPSSVNAQQSRNLMLLAAHQGLDVLWTVTSEAREQELRPIRIPIDRGLFGWRLLLIRAADQARFDAVHSLDQLTALRGGQGHDWPDTPVLQGAGLAIETSPSYEGLFAMLGRGHIDYFPRSVAEIWAELALRTDQPIALEQTLVLHYPSALYFFVNLEDAALAEAIERGLRRAIADGSFYELFKRQYGPAIERAALQQRRVIELPNPLLPEATPLADKPLWFSPEEAR